MTPQKARTEILRAVGVMADTLPASFDTGFWASVVDPIVEMIVRVRGAMSDADRALLMAIAANAIRSGQREREAHEEAAAALRRAGGGA